MEFSSALNTFTLVFHDPQHEVAFHRRDKQVIHKVVAISLCLVLVFNIVVSGLTLSEDSKLFGGNVSERLPRIAMLAMGILAAVAEVVVAMVGCLQRGKGVFLFVSVFTTLICFSAIRGQSDLLVTMYLD